MVFNQVLFACNTEELTKAVKEVINKNLGNDYHWPGNVRELAQCVRRVAIKRDYAGDTTVGSQDLKNKLLTEIDSGKLNAQDLLAAYCTILYQKHGTYEQVSRQIQLDRRTVKKYVNYYSSVPKA